MSGTGVTKFFELVRFNHPVESAILDDSLDVLGGMPCPCVASDTPIITLELHKLLSEQVTIAVAEQVTIHIVVIAGERVLHNVRIVPAQLPIVDCLAKGLRLPIESILGRYRFLSQASFIIPYPD